MQGEGAKLRGGGVGWVRLRQGRLSEAPSPQLGCLCVCLSESKSPPPQKTKIDLCKRISVLAHHKYTHNLKHKYTQTSPVIGYILMMQ